MTERRFCFEPLASNHNCQSFSCGVEALDRYLQRQASQDVRNKVATVLVMFDTESAAVAGFYTLSAASVALVSLPPEIANKLPRYPIQPAILLGRLALDRRYQGQRLGELLLLNALRRSLLLSDDLAAMSVLVDAKDDQARRFYQRFGFLPLNDDQYRLVVAMKSIART